MDSTERGDSESENILNNRWLDVKRVAKHFDMSTRGVWRAVARGELMPPIKIGRCARWSINDVRQCEEILLLRRSNGGTTPA